MHSEHNQPIQPLPCVFVLSWDLVRICIRANYLSLVWDLPSSNMLEAAISVFALQARHVRARFECPGTLPSHSSLIWESHNVQRGASLLSLLLRLSGTLSAPSSSSDRIYGLTLFAFSNYLLNSCLRDLRTHQFHELECVLRQGAHKIGKCSECERDPAHP